MATVGLKFLEGRQFCPLWTHLLSIELWLFPWTCVEAQDQHFIENLNPRTTENYSQVEKYVCEQKNPTSHIDWILKPSKE